MTKRVRVQIVVRSSLSNRTNKTCENENKNQKWVTVSLSLKRKWQNEKCVTKILLQNKGWCSKSRWIHVCLRLKTISERKKERKRIPWLNGILENQTKMCTKRNNKKTRENSRTWSTKETTFFLRKTLFHYPSPKQEEETGNERFTWHMKQETVH